MELSDWLSPALSFVGALGGSGVALWISRMQIKENRKESRYSENRPNAEALVAGYQAFIDLPPLTHQSDDNGNSNLDAWAKRVRLGMSLVGAVERGAAAVVEKRFRKELNQYNAWLAVLSFSEAKKYQEAEVHMLLLAYSAQKVTEAYLRGETKLPLKAAKLKKLTESIIASQRTAPSSDDEKPPTPPNEG